MFDINAGTWLTVTTRGTPMPQLNSLSLVLKDNVIWTFGGCATGTFYNNFAALYIDISLQASNFFASGTGISTAFAGLTNNFTVSILQSTQISNETSSQSSFLWGERILWATDLDFTVLILGTSNSDGSTIVLQITKKDTKNFIDNLDGTYTIKYPLLSGSNYQMFITYSIDSIDYDIPGSPFQLTTIPSTYSNSRSECYGPRLLTPYQKHFAYFTVTLKDIYANPINATSTNFALFKVLINNITIAEQVSYSIIVVGNADNTATVNSYRITYMTPEVSSYNLYVYYDNTLVGDKSYSISAYESIEVTTTVQTAVLAFAIVTAILLGLCIIGLAILYSNPIIIACSRSLMLIYIIGGIVLISGVWLKTDISNLNDSICNQSPWLIGVGFIICAGSVIYKLFCISRMSNTSNAARPIRMKDEEWVMAIVGLVLLECILQIIKFYVDPSFVTTQALTSNSLITYQTCGSNSSTFSVILYGYKALILV